MFCNTFGSFRRATLANLFLVAATIPFLLPDARLLAVQQSTKFDGIWDGQFVNNEKNTGKGQYHFHEEKNAQFSVTVTWWDKGPKKMEIKGERLGPDSLRMTGRAVPS